MPESKEHVSVHVTYQLVSLTSVGIRVGIACCLTGGATNQTKQIWPLHMLAAVGISVALSALLDKEFLSFGFGHLF